jgi:hypothetical protein
MFNRAHPSPRPGDAPSTIASRKPVHSLPRTTRYTDTYRNRTRALFIRLTVCTRAVFHARSGTTRPPPYALRARHRRERRNPTHPPQPHPTQPHPTQTHPNTPKHSQIHPIPPHPTPPHPTQSHPILDEQCSGNTHDSRIISGDCCGFSIEGINAGSLHYSLATRGTWPAGHPHNA